MVRALAPITRVLSARLRAPGLHERGQTLVEYALLLAFIAIVVIAVLLLFGPAVSGLFQSVNNQL